MGCSEIGRGLRDLQVEESLGDVLASWWCVGLGSPVGQRAVGQLCAVAAGSCCSSVESPLDLGLV